MAKDPNGMDISLKDLKSLQKVSTPIVEEFFVRGEPRENLVGMGLGVKWTNGQPTGKPALLALVRQKVDAEELSDDDKIPSKIEGMQTDVLAVGDLFAGQAEAQEFEALVLARRVRPVSGGYSVGHRNITAGTIATCVYDQFPQVAGGVGIPTQYYILSNNHVLANSNNANHGDSILQPGPADGGVDPQDRIGTLSRFVPITFEPDVPRARHRNLVDAALAKGEFSDLKREIHWIGHVQGWLPRTQITAGMRVQKCGRTTNYSLGRITAVNATVDVNYGSGRVARFRDQIITSNMSAGGDSGSLIVDDDNQAVGLLFAGSTMATIVNQIQHVRSLLRIEIA